MTEAIDEGFYSGAPRISSIVAYAIPVSVVEISPVGSLLEE